MTSPRKLLFRVVDWYIIKYHSHDYIRRSLIQDEIEKRIEAAVTQNNRQRDAQEQAKLEAQKLKYDILESGWTAEIINMEKIVSDVLKMRDDVRDLHFRTFQRAKELAMVTAENKHEGTNIINSVAASVGKLDKIGSRAEDIVKEMEDSRTKDEEALRVK